MKAVILGPFNCLSVISFVGSVPQKVLLLFLIESLMWKCALSENQIWLNHPGALYTFWFSHLPITYLFCLSTADNACLHDIMYG